MNPALLTLAYHYHTRAKPISGAFKSVTSLPGRPDDRPGILLAARVPAMWRRFLAHGWTPDRATVGLVVFGFSVASAASGLLLANVALGEVFNIPPPGFVSFPSFPFTYPLAARVEAGSTFIVACAAAFAAAGVLPFTPACIGAPR